MSKDYRGYLTQAGLNYESTAHALGKVVNIAKIGIGNGVLPDDQSPMGLTAMVNKIAEFPAKVYQDEKNPGVFVAECAIPAEHAINGTGYYINEMSAILDNGILYAYRRVSGDFKPLITSGEAKSYLYRLRFIPQNAGVVNVTIDPSVVWPTLADLKREIQRHEESRNHPDASLTEKGFVQLSSASDSTSETLAATPKAVKTVHDLAAGKYTAEDATTAKRGLVQLSNATNSASESTAATSKAVKTAYDLAAGKYTAENATTSKRGLVQLSSATDSTSETLAATPKAVKTVHDLAASKAPVNSPALTGHPTAPTPVDSAVGQEIATAAFVVAKIAKLVNSSPAALDTLQELAAALGNDPNFSATVMNLIGQKLSKDQNGADIPNKRSFVANIGACRAEGAWLSTGGGTWNTAQFIQWLKSAGAFDYPYWMCKTSWDYAGNKVITDTGCGDICLAGVVIEVMGTDAAMTIRVTTPTTTKGGGVSNAQFTYINHGDAYLPGWRRDFNTANPHSHTHTAAHGNHDVISGAWNAVGATVLARLTGGGACAPGGRVYGSSLLVSSASSYAGGGLPGTWQCQGQAFANGTYVELQVTTWIRVA